MNKRRFIALVVASVAFGFLLRWVTMNLLEAMQRSHVKRTTADIHTIAAAWEARASDTQTFAVGTKHRDTVSEQELRWEELAPVSYAELEHALAPKYLRSMPRLDG